MGCTTSQTSHDLEISLRFLIKTISENLIFSRNNIQQFEPIFYLLNKILEKVVREEKGSQGLINALKNFQLNLTLMLQENPFPEGNFIKLILQIQKESQKVFSDLKFDIQAKIKAIETISNTLEPRFLKDFFLNESASFWNKYFEDKNDVAWEEFKKKFDFAYENFFEKEFSFLPKEKMSFRRNMKENLIIMMKYYLETNNDHKITKVGWNVFSFKKMFDFDLKSRFIEDLSYVPTKDANNKILLSYFSEDDEILKTPVEYHISQKGIDFNGYDKSTKSKDMNNDFVRFGRKDENDIILLKDCVSRNHFLVSMKEVIKENQLINEYFINNISQAFVYFGVEVEGYLLAKNSIISLSNAKEFYVKNMHPPYKPNKSYLSIEPEYTEGKRKPPSSNFSLNTRPFIEIEFYIGNINKRYEVAGGDDEDMVISIGSGPHDTLQIHAMDEDNNEDLISKNHCCLKYDSFKKCWVIMDKSPKEDGNFLYKTLMKCHLEGQYENYVGGTIMRGIKLIQGMKLYVSNQMISVKEIK